MIASLTQFRPLRSDVMARRMRAKATGPFRCTACRAAEAAYSTRYARSRVASSGALESKITSLFNGLRVP
jgi:hypothetical protein